MWGWMSADGYCNWGWRSCWSGDVPYLSFVITYMTRQRYYHMNLYSVEVRHHWSHRWLDRLMSQLLLNGTFLDLSFVFSYCYTTVWSTASSIRICSTCIGCINAVPAISISTISLVLVLSRLYHQFFAVSKHQVYRSSSSRRFYDTYNSIN
jgi:hypothetical protein